MSNRNQSWSSDVDESGARTCSNEAGVTSSRTHLVGAVVVREGRVAGEGWHQRFGEAHAEVVALATAGEAACGARLYVTLEPCCHYGKTPPCTDAILRAGIIRVVVAMLDPFPQVAGQGVAALRAAGVTVQIGEGEAQRPAECTLSEVVDHRPAVRSCQVGHDAGRQDCHADGRFEMD